MTRDQTGKMAQSHSLKPFTILLLLVLPAVAMPDSHFARGDRIATAIGSRLGGGVRAGQEWAWLIGNTAELANNRVVEIEI